MYTLLEPVTSSIAITVSLLQGTVTIEVDSLTRHALISQENNQANQGSIAPDTHLTALADLSNSSMEYEKRLVFI
jgi:hypothetical protein